MYIQLILLITLVPAIAIAQQYGIKNPRYQDDFSYLKNDTNPNFYKKLKYLEISPTQQFYVSLGGENRFQIQFYQNEDWGDAPKKQYTAVYNRYLLHASLHATQHFRFFVQFNSTSAVGRPTPNRSIDENLAAWQQLFLDVSPFKKKFANIRVGRQELLFGSQRIVSVREGPNNRLSFDAANLTLRSKRIETHMLYGNPVSIQNGFFDDHLNTSQKIWIFYNAIPNIKHIGTLDAYYIGYANALKRYTTSSGAELRHSFGIRLFKRTNSYFYDFESLYQFGRFGSKKINAYTSSIDVGYICTLSKLKPTIRLKTELISGDKDENDQVLNTFNPLFPRGAYFGLAALIGPVNLIDFHPSVAIQLTKNLNFSFDYDVFWRFSVNDGIYGPNVAVIYANLNNQKLIGHQVSLNFEYSPIDNVSIVPELTWFKAGPYIKESSTGKDVLFSAITVQVKY